MDEINEKIENDLRAVLAEPIDLSPYDSFVENENSH